MKTPCLLRLAKEMGGGGWGEEDNKGGKTWVRERGEGGGGIIKLKTNVISAATERKQCLLLGEACHAQVSATHSSSLLELESVTIQNTILSLRAK